MLSPDGEHILVGGLDATDGVCIINSDGTLATVLEHMPGIMMDDYCFSPDGSLVSVKSYGEFWATSTPTGSTPRTSAATRSSARTASRSPSSWRTRAGTSIST